MGLGERCSLQIDKANIRGKIVFSTEYLKLRIFPCFLIEERTRSYHPSILLSRLRNLCQLFRTNPEQFQQFNQALSDPEFNWTNLDLCGECPFLPK